MSNLDIWTSVDRPPVCYLKKISGGRLNGFTDISPQWRLKCLTEKFGPCGIGWKYTIDRQWIEPATEGAVFCFCNLSLYVKVDGVWSEAIPGTGGHYLVEKESRGLHANDEGHKMALTDAISVAAKALGVAADIYLGNFQGSKYLDRPEDKPKSPRAEDPKPPSNKPATEPEPAAKTAVAKPWKDMTSAEKAAYAVGKLASAAALPLAEGKVQLGKIKGGLHETDFKDPADWKKVVDAEVAAESALEAKAQQQ